MGFIGDFAKGFLIFTLVIWIFSIFMLIYMRQITLALLLFVGLIIPGCMVGYAYLKDRKKE